MSSYSTPRFNSVPTCVGNCAAGPLVQVAGVAVVAVAIVLEGQAKQRAGVRAIRCDGPLQQRDHFARIAAERRDRGGPLVQILRRLLDGARQLVEHFHGLLRAAVVAQRFGLRQRHLIARVAGLLGRLVGRERFGILIERQIRLAQIEMRQGAAVAVRERFDRVAVAAQQIQANAQPGRRRRAAVRLLFQLGRRPRAARDSCSNSCRSRVTICTISFGPNALGERTICLTTDSVPIDIPRNSSRPRNVSITRASGRSRTDNPRITNAVLCRLKLRWQNALNRRIWHSIAHRPAHQSRCGMRPATMGGQPEELPRCGEMQLVPLYSVALLPACRCCRSRPAAARRQGRARVPQLEVARLGPRPR